MGEGDAKAWKRIGGFQGTSQKKKKTVYAGMALSLSLEVEEGALDVCEKCLGLHRS